MAVLNLAAALLALGACYAPELRDCAVTCASNDDCAPGQTCGTDRWCTGPASSGPCDSIEEAPLVDAAVATDAAASAIDASVDATPPGMVQLVVKISGHGVVTIAGTGTCTDAAPGHQCTFAVPSGLPRQLVATGTAGHDFDKWLDACLGQGATCGLSLVAATTTAQAKFTPSNQD